MILIELEILLGLKFRGGFDFSEAHRKEKS